MHAWAHTHDIWEEGSMGVEGEQNAMGMEAPAQAVLGLQVPRSL